MYVCISCSLHVRLHRPMHIVQLVTNYVRNFRAANVSTDETFGRFVPWNECS